MRRCSHSHIILIVICLPTVSELIRVVRLGAIWLGEVVVGVAIKVSAQAAHLVVVCAEKVRDRWRHRKKEEEEEERKQEREK